MARCDVTPLDWMSRITGRMFFANDLVALARNGSFRPRAELIALPPNLVSILQGLDQGKLELP
jgi:hypothetical protein